MEIAGLAFHDTELVGEIPATSSMARKCRLSIDEPSGPLRVLREVGWGIDVFTCGFLGGATDGGVGLVFEFPAGVRVGDGEGGGREDGQGENERGREREEGLKRLGINMWAPIHSTSLLPLLAGCKCHTCTTHHRAYIQHLLSAKEMLGWVLLQIHNHHTISEFFKNIRMSIREGRFEDDCKVFERTYEAELPGGGGTGPRVRGYHFKTEGPGEGRRNEPAWGSLGGEKGKEKGGYKEKEEEKRGLVPDEGGGELERRGFAEVAG